MNEIIKIEDIQNQILIAKYQRIKTGLMQDLLSGKKRVNSLITDGEL